MRSRTLTTLALAVAAVAVLAGCGNGDDTAPAAAAPTPVATTANANQVECVNIERAYNAWSMGRLFSAEDFAAANDFHIKGEMDDQKEFLSEVSGYSDKPSKTLAVAVAELGVELGMLNVQLTLSGESESDQVVKAAAAMVKVQEDYDAWKSAICG